MGTEVSLCPGTYYGSDLTPHIPARPDMRGVSDPHLPCTGHPGLRGEGRRLDRPRVRKDDGGPERVSVGRGLWFTPDETYSGPSRTWTS